MTTWPAIVQREVTSNNDIDHDSQYGPDVYDIGGDLPDIIYLTGPDFDSLAEAAIQSARLGFPAPSGAFLQSKPVEIHLTMDGDALPATPTVNALAPPNLDDVESAKGSIYFGYFGSDDLTSLKFLYQAL